MAVRSFRNEESKLIVYDEQQSILDRTPMDANLMGVTLNDNLEVIEVLYQNIGPGGMMPDIHKTYEGENGRIKAFVIDPPQPLADFIKKHGAEFYTKALREQLKLLTANPSLIASLEKQGREY